MMVSMTPEGFARLYEIFLTTCNTNTRAYELAEEVHFELFGINKYSDIDCFRTQQRRMLKKNKKQNQ